MNFEEIGRKFLNWQIHKKVLKMQRMLDAYIPKIKTSDRTTIKPITGTFICPKPPDYEGIKANIWTTENWITEFKRLQSLGIDTAILQGSVAEDTQKQWSIYYPISDSTLTEIQSITQRLKNPPIKEVHVLPAILDAAKVTNMKIHVGLFNCIHGWFGKSSAQLVQQIQTEEIAIARDLISQYGNHPALAGWYISPEIMYFLHGRTLQLDMNRFLSGITQVLKEATPNLPIGISPGSTLPKGNPEPVIQFWKNTLLNSGVDLLYPQDAVGQLVNFPDKAEKLWKFWNKIAQETQQKLWANCESFERTSFNPPNPFDAASFPRLHWQLAAASPYVDRIVCWECMYFLNSNGAIGGNKLEQEYRQYFKK
jgi:hypothetical protein